MINDFLYNLALFKDKFLTPYKEQLHTASFATPSELAGISQKDPVGTSLLLGIDRFQRILQVRSTPTRRELGNVLVVARSRGGKSLLAVSQLLTWPHSVIVNDIKGELYSLTADYRKLLGDVYKFDLSTSSDKYDPLQGKKKSNQLQSAATNLLHKQKAGENLVFTQRAITMLTQIFMAGTHEGYPLLPYALQMVYLGLADAARKLERVTQKYNLYPNLATRFLDMDIRSADFKDKFLLSCWGTLTGEIDNLLTEENVHCFAGSSFTAREIMQSARPKTIYLCWPERDLLALTPLVRLVWQSLVDELTHVYDLSQGAGCRRVLLLLDELGRTVIPVLPTAVTTINGRDISVWAGIQSLSQLDADYGRAYARIIRDNMDTQIFYRPCDLETAEHIGKRLGFKSGFAHSESKHDEETSQGLSEQQVPLMTVREIMEMPDEEIIGFHSNLPPFRIKRMDWRKLPLLVERQKLKPPVAAGKPLNDNRQTIYSFAPARSGGAGNVSEEKHYVGAANNHIFLKEK